jgi:phosphoglycolate phosphatase-like HAD superfamily hydrolase
MTHEAQPAAALAVEILRSDFPRGRFRAVVFDFDGTLSLLRRNWQDVMIPMMVDVLAETGTGESRRQLYNVVEEFVMRLNGRQTIYQMIRLCEEVQQRGGRPLDPLAYKHRYHDLLWQQVGARIAAVERGELSPHEATVPDAIPFLEQLLAKGLTLYLASGTDLKYVQREADLLGLSEFFGPRIYGALDDYKRFSKQLVIRQILSETGIDGEGILGIGDGFVEIEEVKAVGGAAVGVASNEDTRSGVNGWKRERLVRAGADMIIGDYRCRHELLRILGLE